MSKTETRQFRCPGCKKHIVREVPKGTRVYWSACGKSGGKRMRMTLVPRNKERVIE